MSVAIASASSCAGPAKKTPAPVAPTAPPLKVEQDRFDLELNLFVNLEPQDPRRPALSASLHAQIAAAIDQALARNEPPRAAHALRTLGLMYTPAQLDTPTPVPVLVPSVTRLYEAAGRRGDEQSAVLAFAVLQFIATKKQRETLEQDWPDLLSWLNNIPDSHERPAFASPLRLVLQTCLAYWPSPWIADLLRTSYNQELASLRTQIKQGASPSRAQKLSESMGQIYYWLIRVDLRRGELGKALAQVHAIKNKDPALYPQFSAFDPLFARALDSSLQPGATLELLEKLDPRTMDGPEWLLHDSWSTVRTHASRLIAEQGHKVPRAHAHLARALRGQALTLASVPHYQRAITKLDDKEMWTELAHAHSESLDTQSRYDLAQAKQHLQEIEAFYQKADARFGPGAIEPGLSDARMRLVHALFDAGEIDQTASLSQQSMQSGPRPEALRMLSTIAMHRAQYPRAAQLNEQLTQMRYEDPMQEQRWSVVASLLDATRFLLQHKPQASQASARQASISLDKLLDLPGLSAAIRGELFMQRFEARVLSEDFEGAYLDLQNALRTLPNEASTYLRAMSEYWLHDRLQDARHIFGRAVAQGTLDPVETVYVALWYLDLARRHKDEKAIKEAKDYLSREFADPWTSALARFATGALSAPALLEQAKTKAQRTEAQFYLGLSLAQQGQAEKAKAALDKVRASEMMALVEYRMATLSGRKP